jgi:metallophosphoesterase superfamily enzyme
MTKNMKCVVVSDVHLGIEYSNREKFTDFIENLEDDVERLVLLDTRIEEYGKIREICYRIDQ